MPPVPAHNVRKFSTVLGAAESNISKITRWGSLSPILMSLKIMLKHLNDLRADYLMRQSVITMKYN